MESVGGSVAGVSLTKVVRWDQTTRKKVTIKTGARSWNCEEAGLIVAPGDKVNISAEIIVDEEDTRKQPVIVFTYVPPYGSFNNLRGRVLYYMQRLFSVFSFLAGEG